MAAIATPHRATASVHLRLARIEGQTAGLRRMWDAQRPAEELLDQIPAVRRPCAGSPSRSSTTRPRCACRPHRPRPTRPTASTTDDHADHGRRGGRTGREVFRHHLEGHVAEAIRAGRGEEIVDELMETLKYDKRVLRPLPADVDGAT